MFGWETDRARENNRKWRNVKQAAAAASSRQNATRLDTSTIYNRSSPTIGGSVVKRHWKKTDYGYNVLCGGWTVNTHYNNTKTITFANACRPMGTERAEPNCAIRKEREKKYGIQQLKIYSSRQQQPQSGQWKKTRRSSQSNKPRGRGEPSLGRKYNTHTRATHSQDERRQKKKN